MDNFNCNTEHKKYQHLTSEERHEIKVRLKDGWSIYAIAKHLGRPYNTINNEVNVVRSICITARLPDTKLTKAKKYILKIEKTAADILTVLKW